MLPPEILNYLSTADQHFLRQLGTRQYATLGDVERDAYTAAIAHSEETILDGLNTLNQQRNQYHNAMLVQLFFDAAIRGTEDALAHVRQTRSNHLARGDIRRRLPDPRQ